jgi:hypothetical protein
MPLRYEDIDGDGNRLRLLEAFEFEGITVPAGFVCDGQSWCIGQQSALKGAFVHDYLYWMNGRPLPSGKQYTRKEADRIFLDALRDTKVNPISRVIRYLSLRALGWAAWRGHSKRIENEKENSIDKHNSALV